MTTAETSKMVTDVLRRAAKLAEPTARESEHVHSVAMRSLELVNRASERFDEVVDVRFGGSYAKGTWLRDDVDVDIFAKVGPAVSEGRFKKIGRGLGFRALRAYGPYLRYSQHPYVEAVVEGIKVNVVPCYDVERDRWISAADRSPYHTDFIIKSFDAQKRREARLVKQFMKTVGVYGAEIAKSGFSGYVCEVLILKYGSFVDVLKGSARFRENQVIGIGSSVAEEEDAARLFRSALVILDPIDTKRNLGTAISHESAGRMILASRRFLERPGLGYFAGISRQRQLRRVGRKSTRRRAGGGRGRAEDSQVRRFHNNIVVVRFRYRERSQDIIWGQLKSSLNAIAKQLNLQGFNVIRSACGTDERENSAFVFMLESIRLPDLAVRKGPEVFSDADSARFLARNRRGNLLWVGSDARIMALLNKRFTDSSVFLKVLLTKKIKTSGISKGLIGDMKRYGVEISTGRKLAGIRQDFIRELMRDLVTTDRFGFGKTGRAR